MLLDGTLPRVHVGTLLSILRGTEKVPGWYENK